MQSETTIKRALNQLRKEYAKVKPEKNTDLLDDIIHLEYEIQIELLMWVLETTDA